MNADAPENVFGKRSQDAAHLAASVVNDGQFLFLISVVVSESGRKLLFIGADDGRSILGGSRSPGPRR